MKIKPKLQQVLPNEYRGRKLTPITDYLAKGKKIVNPTEEETQIIQSKKAEIAKLQEELTTIERRKLKKDRTLKQLEQLESADMRTRNQIDELNEEIRSILSARVKIQNSEHLTPSNVGQNIDVNI